MISIVWVRLQKYNFYFETKRKNGIFLLFSFGFQEMEDFRGWRGWDYKSPGFNRSNISGRIIINVNLPLQYQANEAQASVLHLYNIRYVHA